MIEMLQRIWTLVVKEFMLILIDPKSRFVIIVPPMFQFVIFSYAATFDLQNVEYAVLDESKTEQSRTLLNHFNGSPHFELVHTLDTTAQIPELINTRKVRLVLHIPRDFADKIINHETAVIQIIADGRNSNVASVALGYVQEITQQYGTSLQTELLSSGLHTSLVSRAWFNRNLETRWYIVSSLGGIISMVIAMLLSALSVAREREFGTFDQLLVAPFQPYEILIGKAVPCVFFGLADAMILSLGASYWFDVPFRGTISALIVVLLAFLVAVVGVGLFISSMSVTMQQGLLGAFVFIMPSVLLGGFTTPISNMPEWLQTGTLINPLRYVVQALREIFLMGADLSVTWHFIWPLLLISAVTMPAAAVMFRLRTQ
ncbi:ABC transporter permease [Halodesulfovibrio marinisediminis]|uniref:ABC-2 type transport system permease protein n=1 Tax=Halodesulfovibrio marinisediminis DSM 17456 TaxID=1121457 RepID=A0A1N6JA90_9BACT|nr:ABC transporter permease [Halodesulfovibrio marinisediminis]SIO41163.1 ABC-2 type transport system permease protein [Halodesulfovibrio marinisediminis DSM 17456]